MFDVVSIGAATVDIFVKSDQLSIKDNFLSVTASSKNEINQSLICSGGGATNSSVCFSRLGLKSACLSLIGDDHLSNYVIDDLKKESIPTNLLIKNKNDKTDFSIILIAPDGSRSIFTNRGDSRLEEKQINWNKIPKSKWFYVTSLEGNLDLLEKIIGFAKERKTKIAINLGKRELSQRKKVLPLLKLVDFILLNRDEVETLVGINMDHSDFWNNLIKLSPQSIISITNSRKGAFTWSQEKHFFSPIVKTKTIDETGAGDAFGSTFIASLIYNNDVQTSLFWAVKNSASVVSHLGAKSGLLTLKQIKK